MANILEIKKLNFSYGKTTIFKDFNLSVPEGKYISIAGNNTSGKTTLIKLISGILPSKNTVTIGYSYVDNNRIQDHTKELGIVFGDNLNTLLFEDVYKEMAFPLENLNIEPAEIEKRILELAKSFGVSKLLLLDNPFSMMNRDTKIKIKHALKEYQKNNKLTIVLTTTNLDDTIDTDYLYIINDGDILIEGEPLTVLKEDTMLNHLGLYNSFMVDLSLKLKFYELLDDVELDMDRMVNTLWK